MCSLLVSPARSYVIRNERYEKEAALAVEFAGNSKLAGVPADRAFEETATATNQARPSIDPDLRRYNVGLVASMPRISRH